MYNTARTRFKLWARDNGLLARDIASDLNVSIKTVYSWFIGDRYPNRKTQEKIKLLYGIDPADYFEDLTNKEGLK